MVTSCSLVSYGTVHYGQYISIKNLLSKVIQKKPNKSLSLADWWKKNSTIQIHYTWKNKRTFHYESLWYSKKRNFKKVHLPIRDENDKMLMNWFTYRNKRDEWRNTDLWYDIMSLWMLWDLHLIIIEVVHFLKSIHYNP